MAVSPSPLAQASSARASSEAADVGWSAIGSRLRSGPQQPHLGGVATLGVRLPVTGARDGQLADPPVGHDAVDHLPAVPPLTLGLPALRELEQEPARRLVE